MEVKELLELRKLPIGAQLGVLVGGLFHHWISRNYWHFELPETCAGFGLAGALLSNFVNWVLVDPFIRPLMRKRELVHHLFECAELLRKRPRLLARQQWLEVVQKIILNYFVPSAKKNAEKEE
jgi:hypothetical protein